MSTPLFDFWPGKQPGLVNLRLSPRMALLVAEALEEWAGQGYPSGPPGASAAMELHRALCQISLRVLVGDQSAEWPESEV